MKTSRLFLLAIGIMMFLVGVSCVQGELQATPALQPTPALPATPASLIRDIWYYDVAAPSATIIWKTRVPTIGRIEYGTTPEYGLTTPWSERLSTSDGFTLTGLYAYQIYFTRVTVKDAAGNEAVKEGVMQVYASYVYDTYTLRTVLKMAEEAGEG